MLFRREYIYFARTDRFAVDRIAAAVIQAAKLEVRIMRCELSDYEWRVINPMLSNKPCGVPRVDDRRILNEIVWSFRQVPHGATCRKALVPTQLVTIGRRIATRYEKLAANYLAIIKLASIRI